MTEWEPATEAEAAMRDALRANDQELYFRVLARTDLHLPVSAEALAGQAPMGWGTWTTGGRTHVLAFTSEAALRACLGDNGGSSRRSAYHDLAAGWPNHEWWLAVNPGLPIEGYLPAWFVSQLSRGDVRLPGRTLGARARLERAEQIARTRGGGGEPTAPTDAVPPSPPPPRVSSPTPSPYGTNRPPMATPPRRSTLDRSAEATEALRFPPPDQAQPGPDPAGGPGEPVSGWLTNPRRLARPDPGPPPPANGQPAGSAPRNSFFEPAPPGRSAGPAPVSPLRPQERAVPPSRLGEPGRAFPRRRPVQPGDEPTRAFQFTEQPPAEQPPVPPPPPPATGSRFGAPASAAEPTQALPRRQPPPPEPAVAEPTQALPRRMPPPAVAEPTQALPRRTPPGLDEAVGQEPTQPIPPPAGPASHPDPAPVTTSGGYPTAAVAPVADPPGYVDPAPPGYPEAVPSGYAGPVPPGHPDTVPTGYADPTSGTDPSTGYAGGAATGYAGEAAPTEPIPVPPEPRRPPSPVVIEGTVVDSRDLAAPAPAYHPETGVGSGYPADPAPTSPSGGVTGAWGDEPTAVTVPDRPAPEPAGPAPTVSEPSLAGSPVVGPTVAEPTVVESPVAESSVADSSAAEATAPLGTTDPSTVDFRPANDVEEDLLAAAGTGSTDTFLSTLLLARVLLPVAAESAPGSQPGESGFVWRTEQLDGETYVVVYTSPERLADRAIVSVETVRVRFVQLIRRWPDEQWSFAVNPGTPVGAKLPGEQIVALANWAAEVGLGDDVEPEPSPEPPAADVPVSPARYATTPEDPTRPPMMQKAIAPSQLAYYLERGYDRVSGFVHRAGEVAHLNTPGRLYAALGLGYPDSPFSPDADEVYVLRWPAYRPSLYRIPYGGQNEGAMRAMEGWVIERPPFRGNGFAPGESSDVVAEFKVDSARLPHGTQLWRIGADGSERVVAVLDTDAVLWRQVGEA
ncbi:SseB family protein [Micromonospora cathayae]|uniref:SseB family protein n=1 Tax=Micromonospora cathayae TaxID=3028804 RepID=A0ABY7ZTL5_9ACTN|nr:SseB family protein [Micromonospora sp. HUAS 3]WDZ86357.1 SseB family protein [Micromonospora sp. HUAS 3]